MLKSPHQRLAAVATLALVLASRPAAADDSIRDALLFLLTNRSVATDDFERDAQAASASLGAISALFLAELGILPVASPGSGFAYRLDPALGTSVRSSASFGPFFLERSLTIGRHQASFGLAFRNARFDTIDGRALDDGSLVSTAARLQGEAESFDVETVAIRLAAATMTFSANVGVTDRLEIGTSLPFVRLTLDGRRIDTYRGVPSEQAVIFGSASGVGDAVVRAKYNALRFGGSGMAVATELRLPTGSEANLLGTGRTTVEPLLIASLERGVVGLHGDVGYRFGGRTDVLDYGAAGTWAAATRLTIVGEVIGRDVRSLGRLVEVSEAHPTLVGVETIRLSSAPESTRRLLVGAGVKWNVVGTWLLSANVLRPLTSTGLNPEWMPMITFDYAFGR